MTKEEIKLMKEQQAKIEAGYKYQVKHLEEELQTAKSEALAAHEALLETERENQELRAQIQHLQSGLTGEERSFYEDQDL